MKGYEFEKRITAELGDGKHHLRHHLQNQRSVAAKAVELQMFTSNIPQAKEMSILGQSENSNHHYESYLGRKKVLQEQRERKESLLKQLDAGRARLNRRRSSSHDSYKRNYSNKFGSIER